jgi:predicted AAA+ superfamily ATPase
MELQRALSLEGLLQKKSLFLFGPRSTGKSTLIRQQLPGVRTYDLLEDEVFENLLRRPQLIEEQLRNTDRIIVIDEIQKLPKLLNEVHRLIEKRKVRFLLTGSSASKLKRGAANLLGGRAWEAKLNPLTSQELGTKFDLIRYLNIGGLPHVYLSDEPQEELKAYAGLYLREEIIAEGLVRKLADFSRFLEVMAQSCGEELHYQGLSNDTGVQARTIQNYVQILEDTLIGFQVGPFLKTRKRKAITRSKFYLFDLGVCNRLARRPKIEEDNELFGKVFEHFIIREIRSYLDYTRSDEALCYWRSSTSDFEVDAIVGNQAAFEVKSTRSVGPAHLKGLRALREEDKVKSFYVISRDPMERTLDGIRILPWKKFLELLWSGALI